MSTLQFSQREVRRAVLKLRKHFGEGQQTFSNRLGVTTQTIIRWENHSAPETPRLLQLAQLANTVRPDLSRLFLAAVLEENYLITRETWHQLAELNESEPIRRQG